MQPRASMLCFALVASLVYWGGCSDDPKNRSTQWPDGWIPPDGSLVLDRAIADIGLMPDGLGGDVGGPTITVITPKANTVVLGSTLTLRAKITDKDGVDTKSLKATLQGGSDTAMTVTSTPGEYQALLDISKVTNKARLWITAADLLGKKSSKIIEFVRDPGPIITFTAPTEGSRWAGRVTIEVVLSDTAKITDFKVKLGNDPLNMKLVASGNNQYSYKGDVQFDKYTPPLSGKQKVTAEAVNANKAKSMKELTFYVDDEGPDIVVTSHQPGDLIGGIVTIKATVSDLAGITDSTVTALVGNAHDTRKIPLFNSTATPKVYEGLFDTRTLSQTYLWPVLSVRAADKLGNEAHMDIQVGLDNQPPKLEMDPPEDFFMAEDKSGTLYCSRPFDPLGDDAVDDKQQVPQVSKLRTLVMDQGNFVPSAPWIPISEVDETTAFLYVLDDSAKPLVVDTDGDTYCDDINPEVVPLGSSPKQGEAVAVKIASVKPTGSADFRAPSTQDPPPGPCQSWGTESKAPSPLCLGSSLTISMPYSNTLPTVYTIPPITTGAKSYGCVGLPFDFLANKIQPGWVCAAATAKDKMGNRGVSPPLRLYVNLDTKFTAPSDTLPAGAGTVPNCTGTLNKATGKVDASKPCKFRNPRAGSDPTNKIYKCSAMAGAQMYCHRRVTIK